MGRSFRTPDHRSKDITETERDYFVQAREGQRRFRKRVLDIEASFRVTKVDRRDHLVASYCKPWRDCNDGEECLDGQSGLVLTRTSDHLFDRGLITFENAGTLIVSPSVDKLSLMRMGIDADRGMNDVALSEGQRRYLEFHREQVILESRAG